MSRASFCKMEAVYFKCLLPLGAARQKLEALGWTCQRRDSDLYGEYLSCRPVQGAKLRLFEESSGYLLDIVFRSEEPDAKKIWKALRARIFKEALPALGAGELEPRENVG